MFVGLDEKTRQYRITNRGKSELDKVLDDSSTRDRFIGEFNRLLVPESTVYVNNNDNLENTIQNTYQKIKRYQDRLY